MQIVRILIEKYSYNEAYALTEYVKILKRVRDGESVEKILLEEYGIKIFDIL